MTRKPARKTAKKQAATGRVGKGHPPKSGQFAKGYDPRRNLLGVPKDAIAMRHMLRDIAAELVKIKAEDGSDVEITRLYARARLAFSSKNPKEWEMILKAMFPGLLRDEVDVTSKGENITGANDDLRTEILRKLDSIAAAQSTNEADSGTER